MVYRTYSILTKNIEDLNLNRLRAEVKGVSPIQLGGKFQVGYNNIEVELAADTLSMIAKNITSYNFRFTFE